MQTLGTHLCFLLLLVCCGCGGGGDSGSGSFGVDDGASTVPPGLVGSWRMLTQDGRAVDNIVDLSITATGRYYFHVRRPDSSFLRDFTAVFTYVDGGRYELRVESANCSFDPCSPRTGLRFATHYFLTSDELTENVDGVPNVYRRR